MLCKAELRRLEPRQYMYCCLHPYGFVRNRESLFRDAPGRQTGDSAPKRGGRHPLAQGMGRSIQKSGRQVRRRIRGSSSLFKTARSRTRRCGCSPGANTAWHLARREMQRRCAILRQSRASVSPYRKHRPSPEMRGVLRALVFPRISVLFRIELTQLYVLPPCREAGREALDPVGWSRTM